MNHPLVRNCRSDAYEVYIGRPGPWGNPFVVGRDGDRETVIAKYKEWFWMQGLGSRLHLLTGKTLGCWCKPLPCHGDFLAEMANPK